MPNQIINMNNVNSVSFNNNTVNEIYLNSTKIWPITPVSEPFITFSSPNSFRMTIDGSKSWDGTIEYSTNKTTWNTWSGSAISAVKTGTRYNLYFRGTGNTLFSGSGGTSFYFNSGSDISVSGNMETLLDYQTVMNGQHPVMAQHCFRSIFYHLTQITDISGLELPATTLTGYCYYGMFNGCTGITTVPSNLLPATTLAPSYCYANMFYGCTSLTTAPKLPIRYLQSDCYSAMFRGCTSLTQAPELPATTLENSCYSSMFYGCTSLTTAPKLPTRMLKPYCYSSMFSGCTSLYVSDTQTPEAQYEWRIPGNGVISGISGTTYSQSGMFTGCLGTRASNNLAGQVGQQYIYYTQNEPV